MGPAAARSLSASFVRAEASDGGGGGRRQVGLWNTALRLLAVPALTVVLEEQLAADAIPRSVLLATLEAPPPPPPTPPRRMPHLLLGSAFAPGRHFVGGAREPMQGRRGIARRAAAAAAAAAPVRQPT